MADVFREKINLRASRFSVRPNASHFAFAGHRAVILRHWHRLQHLHVEIVGKHAVESQMIKRRLVRVRRLNRVDDEIRQIVD